MSILVNLVYQIVIETLIKHSERSHHGILKRIPTCSSRIIQQASRCYRPLGKDSPHIERPNLVVIGVRKRCIVEVKTADRLPGLLLGRFENIEDKKRYL
jgi:hypothetical protein